MYNDLKLAITETLDLYENELGRRSAGLAYLQSKRDRLFLIVEKENDYYKNLEKRNELLAKENNKLRKKLAMPMPDLDFKMKLETDIATDTRYFQWRMDCLGYRKPLPPLANDIDIKTANLIRRESYKGILKLIRKVFDENFNMFIASYKK